MRRILRLAAVTSCVFACTSIPAAAQLRGPEKIGFSEGILTDRLSDLDAFGSSVASPGDLDGDGVADLAVGSPLDDDGGASLTSNLGAVWILFLTTDGTVRGSQEISSTRGGFGGDLDENDQFGASIAALGDLDGDDVPDLVVGAPYDDDGGRDRGAVWILLMTRDGTVKDQLKISDLGRDWAGGLKDGDHFGHTVASLGDLDGNGSLEIAVGAPDDDDGGTDSGSLWILSLGRDGTAGFKTKISRTQGGFDGQLEDGDRFGSSIAGLGDVSGDGTYKLAVGAPFDDDGSTSSTANRGGVWVLSLDSSGKVEAQQKISATEGGFDGALDDNDHFGESAAPLGDLDGDGNLDLLVGSSLDDDGGETLVVNRGAAWILFMRPDGTVGKTQKLADGSGDFNGDLDDNDRFGAAVGVLGDLDGDNVVDVAVGAPLDDDGGMGSSTDRGAVWVLFLRRDGTTRPVTKISSTSGDFAGTIDDNDHFGWSLASLGGLGRAGRHVLAVGAPEDDDGGRDAGAVWLLFLNHGTVTDHRKLSNHEGNFPQGLKVGDRFGASVASMGDLDGDGVTDLAVGAPNDDDGGEDAGAVWILLLDSDGRVRLSTKLTAGIGNFSGRLDAGDRFGASRASAGDLNGDGVTDLAVGAPGDDDGFLDAGAVRLLFLNPDGTVKAHEKISRDSEVAGLDINQEDRFGAALAAIGDLNGDGVTDLAVGAPKNVGSDEGAIWILLMNSSGSVDSVRKLEVPSGDPASALPGSNRFGTAISQLGDLDGDAVPDIVVSSSLGSVPNGVVTAILLHPDATVKSAQKHGPSSGDFAGQIPFDSGFGAAIANLGDLDGDGIADLGVGAPFDDDGGFGRGVIWISYNALIPPPAIEEVQVAPNPPRPGERLSVTARIVALNGVRSAAINFRLSGDADFLTAPLNPIEDQRFGLTIPAFVTGTRGIEYFITAENIHGQETRNPSSGVVSLPVFLPDGVTIALAAGTAADAYRLYSVPIELDDRSARTMLEDNLGSYNEEEWRFFGYSNDVHRAELNVQDLDLTPGAAFWLLVREAGLTINTGPGTTVPTDRPYELSLRAGWNYIGNPFNFSVPLSMIQTRSGQPVDARTYTGLWAGVQEAFDPTLAYAVFNDSQVQDTLVINPDLSGLRSDTVASASGKGAAVPGTVAPAPGKRVALSSNGADDDGWSIRILAQSGRARDTDNVAAVSALAAPEWDILDRPEPPVVGDYVSVSFPHPEWNRIASRFSTDARPAGSEGTVWSLEIRTGSPGAVTVSFENLESVPSQLEVRLIDEELGVSRDLRKRNDYVVASMGFDRSRSLKLAVGTASFVTIQTADLDERPARFELFQNFPNPFRGVTTIRYGLPETSKVTLTVLNVLGKRIAMLASDIEQAAGYHHVIWDGRTNSGTSVSSGTYFLQVRAGRRVATRSLVVVQ